MSLTLKHIQTSPEDIKLSPPCTSDVSSELGARLRVELEQTERLDAQFVEYLRCRGMNPTVNTDSAAGSMSYSNDLLSPELQVWFTHTW